MQAGSLPAGESRMVDRLVLPRIASANAVGTPRGLG